MNIIPLNATTSAGTSRIADMVADAPTRPKSLTGAALRNASPEQQRTEVAAQFEAILVRQLLAPTMTSMLGEESGPASNVYGDLMTDTFSQQLTRGGGLGLGRLLEKQLAPRAPRAALNTASAAS
jgi:Rod binding domain-containing protein